MVETLGGFCLGDRIEIVREGGWLNISPALVGERGRIIHFDTEDNSALIFLETFKRMAWDAESDDRLTQERINRGLSEGWFERHELQEDRCIWAGIRDISLKTYQIKWID